MRQLKLFRWAAVLTLAIALAPGAASAQEADTITISGTFSMDSLSGTVGPDLAEVFANGHEHTWALTLDGTSQTHHRLDTLTYRTTIHATSFDLEFFGPDAAMLNGIVSEHIAGADVLLRLWNGYSVGLGFWEVSVFGSNVWFWTGELSNGWNTLFPSDANGYPVVGPDPLSIWSEGQLLGDSRPGNGGWIESFEDRVTFAVIPIVPGPAGDFNHDGVVDAADYVLWRKNNIDGESDYNDWRANFSATAAGAAAVARSASASAVPEPASIGLLLPLAAAAMLRRRSGAHRRGERLPPAIIGLWHVERISD